jgi:glutathione synthase/RimK-type ligase-like ATP-grasp enzyme
MAPEAFWVNPLDAAIRAERKPYQHQIAVEVGFATPATLYTNDPQEIRAFLKRKGGRIAYKPFHGVTWDDGKTQWTPYTSLITESTLVEDDLLHAVPGIYQEIVPKDYELRLTVMGERVFSAKIRSQETLTGRLDWRRSYDELRIEACEVPSEVAERCRQMLHRLGLVFGCFDLIVTPAGEYIFLEVNQMGQFLFVERYAGIPLLDAFAEFLLQARPDFEWNEANVIDRYVDLMETLPRMEAEFARDHVPSPDRAVREALGRTGSRKQVRT